MRSCGTNRRLYSFFWLILRCLNFMYRRFGTFCSIFIGGVHAAFEDGTEYEERKDQQDTTIRFLLLTSVSTCFWYHYAHLQENKHRVTEFGVLFWFCWMWLVAVVGRCVVGCGHYSAHILQDSASQPLPTTSSRTRATLQIQ